MSLLSKISMGLAKFNECLGANYSSSKEVDAWWNDLEEECSKGVVNAHRLNTYNSIKSWMTIEVAPSKDSL